MGAPKLALEFEGRTLLARAVETALQVSSHVVVVVGAYAELYTSLAEAAGARVVVNPEWREGLASSLRAGVASLLPETEAALVVLGDQPLVPTSHFEKILEVYRAAAATLVFSSYEGVRGAPTLIAASLFGAVQTLTGDTGARALQSGARVAEVPLAEAFDVDTPDDAARLNLAPPCVRVRLPRGSPMTATDTTSDLFAGVLDTLPVGVIVFKPVYDGAEVVDLEWQFMNHLALRLGMVAGGERLGKKLLEVAPELADGPLFKALRAAVTDRQAGRLEQFFSGETSVTGKDCWYSVHTEPFRQGVVVVFEDITQQKRAEARIKKLVFRDELTGIHNRRYFLAQTPELLSIARREAWTCALIYFDLDGFKDVNDLYGHHVGDQVLKGVARRLGAVKREGDVFFRSGGDEFALFLPNAEKKAALATAERIAERLVAPFELAGAAQRVGVSIGVAVMLSEEASVEDLLSRADKAMYAAKARQDPSGHTIVLWEPGLFEDSQGGPRRP